MTIQVILSVELLELVLWYMLVRMSRAPLIRRTSSHLPTLNCVTDR